MVKIQSLLCPTETCWISHDRACKAFYKDYKQFLDALAICYNERKESEALGLFILAITPKVIATVLLLLEVFNCIGPLIPFLQKGQDSWCISQAQAVADLTLLNLKNALYKINLFYTKRVTKLIRKLLSKFYCYLCRQEPFKFSSFQRDT